MRDCRPNVSAGNDVRSEFAGLILLFSCFLTIPLARQCFFYSTALARFQVEGVTLHFLNNVFLLNLALKPAQCIFKRLAFLHANPATTNLGQQEQTYMNSLLF